MKVLRAARMIDGTGKQPVENSEVHVDGTKITYAGPSREAPPVEPAAEVIDVGGRTLMPGLIDCHAHPLSPFFPSNQAEVFAWTDEYKLLYSVQALEKALLSGVTTLRDCGAPRGTAYTLKEAVDKGAVLRSPRLVVAGRAVCPTGGHMYNGGSEADGPVGVRQAVRQLFKEGSQFIKLTATGGGTAGTHRHRATFTVDEMAAAADEAEHHESYATAHCHGLEGMWRCVEAGVHMLEHGSFVGPDNVEHWDPELAKRIRDQNIVVVPTVQVHGRWTQDREGRYDELSAEDKGHWGHRSDSFYRRVEIVGKLHEMGVTLLMGSDSAWRTGPIDDLGFGLQLHVKGGVPAMEAIRSATGLAAERIGLSKVTGSLAAGMEADVIAVDGDPLADISATSRVDFVMRAGQTFKSPAV